MFSNLRLKFGLIDLRAFSIINTYIFIQKHFIQLNHEKITERFYSFGMCFNEA